MILIILTLGMLLSFYFVIKSIMPKEGIDDDLGDLFPKMSDSIRSASNLNVLLRLERKHNKYFEDNNWDRSLLYELHRLGRIRRQELFDKLNKKQ